MKGLVIFKTNSGPKRFKEDLEYVHLLGDMNNIGLKIIPYLPNTTSVNTELNQFCRPFNGSCRSRTLDRLTKKLEDDIMSIRQDMTNKKARMATNFVEEVKN